MLGLYAEYSGLLIKGNIVSSADLFNKDLEELSNMIDSHPDYETAFHAIGLKHINSVNNKLSHNKLVQIYGNDYKRNRFHCLVRAGGDIIKSNLSLSKPTLLGGMIYLNKRHNNISP